MPKVVDHGQRRGEMVAALWRIAAYEGLEAVSLGRVAAEAGVSKGRVQHYFGTRDALLEYTAAYLTDRVTARLGPRLAAAPDAAAAVRGALLEVLPLTEDSIVDTRVGIAFLIRALGDEALHDRYSGRNAEFLELLTHYLTAARDEGSFDTARDPSAVAVELFALVNGLKEPLLLGDLTPEGPTRSR